MGKIGGMFALLVFLTACATPPRPADGAAAQVRRTEGQAELLHAGDSWHAARPGQAVGSGDTARTGNNGQIDFHLGEYGGVLTLWPNSVLAFERIGPNPTDPDILAVLHLSQGRVTGDTLKLPRGTRILIKTLDGAFEIP